MSDNHKQDAAIESIKENRANLIMRMLHAIAKREGIENPKIDLSKGSERGDGFIGEKSRAILRGNNKSMDLFVKGSPTNDVFRKAFDPRRIYLLEIMFYNDVYPTFNKFQTEKQIPKPFTCVSDCIDTCSEEGNEILILQNAISLGYELTDKMKQLNKEHLQFVYTEFGKYHGICFALKDQQHKVYQALLDKLPYCALDLTAEKMTDGLFQMAEIGKVLFDPEKEADKYNTYSAYLDNLPEFIQNLVHHNDPYMVIVHGDCWSNNMMFKYAINSNKSCPKQMFLVDFQTIGQSSPVLDLSFVMYACSPKEIYNNMDHYLRVYHDSLSETITDLGSDPEVLFPYEELKNQWKMFSRYGLLMASCVLKICVQERDEVVEFAEEMNEKNAADSWTEFRNKVGKHEALFHERFKNLIEHMVEKEFI